MRVTASLCLEQLKGIAAGFLRTAKEAYASGWLGK
jgi:hypothetical protein